MAANKDVSPKLDLKKSMPSLYNQRGSDCTLVTPPVLQVVAIDGSGDPNSAQSWSDAVGALYSITYTLKFMLKKVGATPDFAVMPLEALWWVPDEAVLRMDDKSNWQWRGFMVLPGFVTQAHIDEARASAYAKKENKALSSVVFTEFDEGWSAQVLHIGPYATEPPTIARLHAFIGSSGLVPKGRHHEIYLSDPARTAPEKMKTILRQPVQKATART